MPVALQGASINGMGSFLAYREFWRQLAGRVPLEALLWLVGLALMACADPHADHLFSFCPFSWVLESGCPGCGLGHGIAFLARGEWRASWEAHPLAVPAVWLLLWRSGKLVYFRQVHPSLKPPK